MSFKYDKSNAGLSVTEAGLYEVYPTSFKFHVSQAGNQVIDLNYRVRSDVDQPFGGATINFDSYNDNPKAKYRIDRFISCLSKEVPDGYDFGTIMGWANKMMGQPVKVQVTMEPNQAGDKTYATVKSVMETQYPQVKEQKVITGKIEDDTTSQQGTNNQPQQNSDPFAGQGTQIDIKDSDLPF